jgi:hypothetical protein
VSVLGIRFQDPKSTLVWIAHSTDELDDNEWLNNDNDPTPTPLFNNLHVWLHDRATKGDAVITQFAKDTQDPNTTSSIKSVTNHSLGISC